MLPAHVEWGQCEASAFHDGSLPVTRLKTTHATYAMSSSLTALGRAEVVCHHCQTWPTMKMTTAEKLGACECVSRRDEKSDVCDSIDTNIQFNGTEYQSIRVSVLSLQCRVYGTEFTILSLRYRVYSQQCQVYGTEFTVLSLRY